MVESIAAGEKGVGVEVSLADVVVVVNKSARGEMRVTPGDTLSPHATDTSATSDAEEAKELEAVSASRDADHDIVTRATEQSKPLPQPLPQPPPPQPQPQPKAQLKPQPEPKSRPKSTPTPKLKSKAKPKPPPKLKLKPNPLLSRRLCTVSGIAMTTPLRCFFWLTQRHWWGAPASLLAPHQCSSRD